MDLKEIALNESHKRHPWELARVKVISRFLKSLPNISKDVVTILDVGSGDTFLIKELSKEFGNARFFAIDTGYNAEYLQNANTAFEKEKINIRVFNDLTSSESEIDHPVDVILLLDVIEHVPDDVQFLKDLAAFNKVTDQTLFLITVPSYQKLFCTHDVFLGHYRRYNNKLLIQNITKANLKALDIGYFFTFPLAPRFIQVLKEKLTTRNKDPKGIGNWEGNRFVSKFLEGMLLFDFSVSAFLRKFKIKLPGLSNFAVCKRSVSSFPVTTKQNDSTKITS